MHIMKKIWPYNIKMKNKIIKCLAEFLEQSNCSNPTICHWWLEQEEIKSEFVAEFKVEMNICIQFTMHQQSCINYLPYAMHWTIH